MSTSGALIFDEYESQVQSYARLFPTVFKRASGAELWDVHGRRYLDFLSGCGSLNYGHNNPAFKRELMSYIERDGITHSLDFHTEAKAKFLETMRDVVLKPRKLDYVVQFPGPTGTNAVEAALKLARKVTGRSNVISFTNGFHGVSLGALAATGNRYHRTAAGLPLFGATIAPYDGYVDGDFDTIDYLGRLLRDPASGIDSPAAVIVETVQGEGGLNVARIDWLKRLQALCREQKMLLIVDDIQAGCGRTGTFFSFESAGIEPDIVTLAKSLSGYGSPLALVLIKRSLDIWNPGEHNGTFRGNNHAFVTATAALSRYWADDLFATQLAQSSTLLSDRLKKIVETYTSQLIDVRGRGMLQGIRFADPARAASVAATAFRDGLVIERCGPHDEVIKCLPPLTISVEHLHEGMAILEGAIAAEFTGKLPPLRKLDQKLDFMIP